MSACLTSVPGASEVFLCGVVAYADAAKQQLLGLESQLLATYGAVSSEAAAAMVIGVQKRSHAELALSVTGIAGPGGGSPGKPVGQTFLALMKSGMPPQIRSRLYAGSRDAIRQAAVVESLHWLSRQHAPAVRR